MDPQPAGIGVVTASAAMGLPAGDSRAVLAWWAILGATGVVNVLLWIRMALRVGREEAQLPPAVRATQRRLLLLSGLFVAGCAFRALLPRIEGHRICLYDSWISSAFIGRAVATVAELAFVTQWMLLFRELFRGRGVTLGAMVARLIVPLIAIAEVFSWYSALTTNYLGSVIEESLWATTSALMLLGLVQLWRRGPARQRRLVRVLIGFNVLYVAFMSMVDVPMYLARWQADQARGKPYLSLPQGLHDSRERRIVTRRWDDWWQEMPWMSLYFGAAVWLSIGLVRIPRVEAPPKPS